MFQLLVSFFTLLFLISPRFLLRLIYILWISPLFSWIFAILLFAFSFPTLQPFPFFYSLYNFDNSCIFYIAQMLQKHLHEHIYILRNVLGSVFHFNTSFGHLRSSNNIFGKSANLHKLTL